MNTRVHHIQNWLGIAKKNNWSTSRMAKDCGISVRSLERFFLKKMGDSPQSWLSEQRQQWGYELLKQGASVKEAAALLGYKYAHHFSREFKKHWGHPPTQVRSQRLDTVSSEIFATKNRGRIEDRALTA